MSVHRDLKEGMIVRPSGSKSLLYISEMLYGVRGATHAPRGFVGLQVIPINSPDEAPKNNAAILKADDIGNQNTDEKYSPYYYISKDPMWKTERDFDKTSFLLSMGELQGKPKEILETFLNSDKYKNIQISNLPKIDRRKKRPALKEVTDMYLATARDMNIISSEAYDALKDSVATVRQALELLKKSSHNIDAPIYKFSEQYPDIQETDTSDISPYQEKIDADPVIRYADTLTLEQAKEQNLFRIQNAETTVQTFKHENSEEGNLGYAIGLRVLDPDYLSNDFGLSANKYTNVVTDLKTAYNRLSKDSSDEILFKQFEDAVQYLNRFDEMDREKKVRRPRGKTIKCFDPAQEVSQELQEKMNENIAQINAGRPDISI